MRFPITIRYRTVAAVALFAAFIEVPSPFASEEYANITVDTSRLSGSVAEVVFVLTGTNRNNVTLSNFDFGGGSAGNLDNAVIMGNAYGSFLNSISMADSPSSFTNVFAGQFTAGSTLSFHLALSTIQDATFPDQFSFYLYGPRTNPADPFSNPVTTNDLVGFNSLLTANIDSPAPRLQTFQCPGGACAVTARPTADQVIYWSNLRQNLLMKTNVTANTTTSIDNQTICCGLAHVDSLIFDPNGNIIYTETAQCCVATFLQLRRFNPITKEDKLITDQLDIGNGAEPLDLALDPSGKSVLVSVNGFFRTGVVRVDLTTGAIKLLTPLIGANGITYDNMGRLFALDSSGILQIDPVTGRVLPRPSGGFLGDGLTYDPVTNLLWAASGHGHSCLQAFDPNTLQMVGSCVGNFVNLDGVESDGKGNIIVADRGIDPPFLTCGNFPCNVNGKVGAYNIAAGTSTYLFDAPGLDDIAPLVGLGAPPAPTPIPTPGPDKVSISQTTNNGFAGGTHTIIGHTEGANGSPVPGATVTFKVLSGPNVNTTGSGITDNNGNAPFTYTDTGGLGIDTLQAFVGNLSSNVLTMTWTRIPTITSISAPAITYNADGVVMVAVTSPAGIPTGNATLIIDNGAPMTAALANGSATFRVPSPSAGDHTLNASYGTQANWTASSATGNLHVNPRQITITANAKSKTYGDPDPALTYQITSGSLVNGDSFTGDLTRAAGENVGTYAIRQSALALSANYTLTFAGANLTITPAPLSVIANSQTKVYGAMDPTLTYQASGLKFSETAATALTGTLTRAPGESVAGSPYAITQGTLAGANYTISFTGNTLTITPAPLGITANPQTKIYGNPDPALTYQVSGLQLIDIAAMVLTGALGRAPGETVIGGPYGISLGTLKLTSTNYTLGFTGNMLTITPRLVTVTADAQSKVYGTADPPLTYKITNGNVVFNDIFSGALSRVAGENVGPYAILQGTLTLGTNYTLTYIGTGFTITSAPTTSTVSSAANPSVYGQQVTFTATVSRTMPAVIPGTATPVGTVTFMDGGRPIGTGGLINGVATFSIGFASPVSANQWLVAGTHSITGVYSPAAPGNFLTSTSPADIQTVNKAQTSAALGSSLNPAMVGSAVTFTASVGAVPPGAGIPTGTITFTDGPTVLGTVAANGFGQATLVTTSLAVGVHTIAARYNGDPNFLASPTATFSELIYDYPNGPGGGTFVVGDLNAAVGTQVTFWDAQWDKLNPLSGGSAPASFKGFADSTSTAPPSSQGTWTGNPGNSSKPPDSLPAYMAVIVSSSITRSRSSISGNILRMIVVQTAPGYEPNPGHAGTGTVLAVIAP